MGCLISRGKTLTTEEEKFNYIHGVFLLGSHIAEMDFEENWKILVEKKTKIAHVSDPIHENEVILGI